MKSAACKSQGWYDFFLEGALEDFAKAQSKGNQASPCQSQPANISLAEHRLSLSSFLPVREGGSPRVFKHAEFLFERPA